MITLEVLSLKLEDVEKAAVEAALRECPNNKTQAALLLGCDRRSLYRKMERLGLLTSAQNRAVPNDCDANGVSIV